MNKHRNRNKNSSFTTKCNSSSALEFCARGCEEHNNIVKDSNLIKLELMKKDLAELR